MCPDSVFVTDWPLTGRDDELRAATAALAGGTAVVVVGDAGVGRTRLLREVLRAWDGPTEWVVATAAGKAVPFGAVGHLRGDSALVGVDDAHLLDDGSAAVLHQLAVRRVILPIVSIRCGERVSDAVTALWKDGGLRVSLAPLPVRAIDTLLDHALPGTLDPISRRRVTRLVAGNPLLLRELLADARDTGALVRTDGVYRWRGPAPSPRVAELMNARLRAVQPAVRAVLEVIACGEPLAMRLLEQLTEPAAVEAAERSGLAVAERSGARTVIRLAHPLYAEALRATLPAGRAREVWAGLAAAITRTPMRRRDDAFLAGSWQLRAGVIDRADLLLDAARRAVARFDLDLAERLARAATGPDADQLRAEILANRDRGPEADGVLPAWPRGDRWAVTRASILYWGLGRVDEAERTLPDGELAEATRSWILLFDGRCRTALESAQRVRHDPQAVSWAAMSGAMAAGLLGRPALAADIAERGRKVAAQPWGAAEVGFGACCALWAAGQPLQARVLADDGHRAAVTSESTYMAAIWAGLRGVVARAQGHLATARAALSEAVALAADCDPAHVLRPCLAQLAATHALTGDTHTARRLITRADGLARPDNRLYDAWVELDRAWVYAAEGALSEATGTAARAAKLARESEQPAFEAVALYDAARLGAAQHVLPRLRVLADELEGGYARSLSRAAGALATGDEDELEQVATAFAGRGHLLLAAELYTVAAHALRHSGKRVRARAATGHAGALLAGECRGARTPLLDLAGPGAVLTPREREIALLATTLPSRHIAERLGLSVHTVNNTLARAYTKLAVRNRRELVSLLGKGGPTGPAPR